MNQHQLSSQQCISSHVLVNRLIFFSSCKSSTLENSCALPPQMFFLTLAVQAQTPFHPGEKQDMTLPDEEVQETSKLAQLLGLMHLEEHESSCSSPCFTHLWGFAAAKNQAS